MINKNFHTNNKRQCQFFADPAPQRWTDIIALMNGVRHSGLDDHQPLVCHHTTTVIAYESSVFQGPTLKPTLTPI